MSCPGRPSPGPVPAAVRVFLRLQPLVFQEHVIPGQERVSEPAVQVAGPALWVSEPVIRVSGPAVRVAVPVWKGSDQ